jgi:hypothetical protein
MVSVSECCVNLHEIFVLVFLLADNSPQAGFVKKRVVVEVYPMAVRVVERRRAKKQDVFEISKAAPAKDLLRQVALKWYMAPHR